MESERIMGTKPCRALSIASKDLVPYTKSSRKPKMYIKPRNALDCSNDTLCVTEEGRVGEDLVLWLPQSLRLQRIPGLQLLPLLLSPPRNAPQHLRIWHASFTAQRRCAKHQFKSKNIFCVESVLREASPFLHLLF